MKLKSEQLIGNVEPLVAVAAWQLVRDESDTPSMSSYIRDLVIKDLRAKGRLTDEMVDELL